MQQRWTFGRVRPKHISYQETKNISFSCQTASYHHFTYQLSLLIMGKKLSKTKKDQNSNIGQSVVSEEKIKRDPKPEPGTEPTDDDLEVATAEAAQVLDHVTKSRPQVYKIWKVLTFFKCFFF